MQPYNGYPMNEKDKTPKQMNCGVQIALHVFGGRWKLVILYFLIKKGDLRFGEVKNMMPLISKKILTSQLRDLEKEGLICKKIYGETTTHTRYSVTDYGLSLKEIILTLREWGENHSKREIS